MSEIDELMDELEREVVSTGLSVGESRSLIRMIIRLRESLPNLIKCAREQSDIMECKGMGNGPEMKIANQLKRFANSGEAALNYDGGE